MLTQAETRRLMGKPEWSIYVHPNKVLKYGIVKDLTDTCSYFCVNDVERVAKHLDVFQVPVFIQMNNARWSWTKKTIEVVCKENVGEYADAVGPLKFRGGPQLRCRPDTDDKPYKIISGTLLTWCMDQILYYASIRGDIVLKQLNIPL